ncbi:phospholipid carrier-dependent glycosyltransferase, partial [Patescibacteria group bacterium]|nr:phospholipid carrier-dependent glycosyltransferase [Patescibacteria group bacterium]
LILILILAAFLRFYRLSSSPPSLQWDETAIGYNAYSVLKTGRDEYGKFLPLIFKSFGDYKPGLYIYLTVPSVALFGLNELAVRLPSALVGVASVWLIYQLAMLLFKKRPLALFVSLALSTSPWAIHFSRGAWEANLALFLVLLGIFSFLKACLADPLRREARSRRAEAKKFKWLYLPTASFALTLFAYQSSKLFLPLVILGLIICFYKKIKSLPRKHLLISLALFLIIAAPIYLSIISGGGGRLKVMSLFSYPRPENEIQHILNEDEGNMVYFNLFHSESLSFATRLAERYFNHFSGKFLFFEGDWSNLRHSPPYMGVLYFLDFLFLLTGAYWLIRQNSNQGKFIWFWLLISPLPAALSRDSIQATRSLNMVLPLMIIVGCGLYQIYLWFKNQKKAVFILYSLFFILSYLWCFAYYLDQYYIHYPRQSSQYWQYGYKQVVQKVYPLRNNYEKIVFTPEYGQPHIYWLFHGKYPPSDYQAKARLTENPSGDVGKVEKLDNVEFRSVSFDGDKNLSKTLLIGTELEIPLEKIDDSKQKILEEIKFLNGKIAFRIVEVL